MSARVLNNPLESVPMVLGALRDALLELQEAGSTPALLLRIEALAALLPGAGPVPMGLQELAAHLDAFGRFLERTLATPESLAQLAVPTAELCLAWQISAEALALPSPVSSLAC